VVYIYLYGSYVKETGSEGPKREVNTEGVVSEIKPLSRGCEDGRLLFSIGVIIRISDDRIRLSFRVVLVLGMLCVMHHQTMLIVLVLISRSGDEHVG
jgi:hypothetical protein